MLNKKPHFEKEEIDKFSLLLQFYYKNLTADKINEKLLNLDPKFKKYDKNSKFDEIVGYAVKAVDDAMTEINNICKDSVKFNKIESNFDRLLNYEVVI